MNLQQLKEKLPSFIRYPDPELYLKTPYRVVDFETTNKDKGSARNPDNRLVLGHITYADSSIPLRFSDGYNDIPRLFAELEGRLLVAHNAKFELHWLRRLGYPIENLLVFDTLLAEKVLAGNRGWPLDLDSLSDKYGGSQKNPLIKSLMQTGICPSEMPQGELQLYCAMDCWNTQHIFLQQLKELQRLNLLQIVYTRCLLLPVLVDIECQGMQLDEQRVAEEYNGTKREYDKCLDTLAGYLNGANPNSPKQLASVIYDVHGFEELKDRHGEPIRTATGARKTDKPTLAGLRARTTAQKSFLDALKTQAKLDTKLNNYLEKFRNACKEDGGILYGELNQINPRTHRLSSNGGKHRVQFQNMDRTLKPMFKPRHEGWSIFEADEAQLEFRVAAMLTHDEQAISDILNKVDVHSITRDFLESKGEKFLTITPKDRRTESKPVTFKPVFGGTSGTDAVKEYCKFFNQKYSTMYKEQSKWEMQVLKDKMLVTPWGMRFYWPDIAIRYNGKTTEHSAIFNYPVQSFATAEIVPIGLIYVWHFFKAAQLKSFLINTVHDSIVGEMAPDEEEIVENIVNQSLTRALKYYLERVYRFKLNVPLEAEFVKSHHWGEH